MRTPPPGLGHLPHLQRTFVDRGWADHFFYSPIHLISVCFLFFKKETARVDKIGRYQPKSCSSHGCDAIHVEIPNENTNRRKAG